MPCAVEHGLELGLVVADGAVDDPVQFFAVGIGDQDLHEEPVELGFGKRIGSFHFDRVLRGHHEEGKLELVRGGAAGHGALLHRFEQRGLRFREWRD